jgi:hypothetical protein
MKALFSLLIVISSQSAYGGFPVVDTNEVMKQLSDSLFFISSVDSLLNEVGAGGEEVRSMTALSHEIQAYQRELLLLEQLQLASGDARHLEMGRSRALIDQINSITRHVQKIRRVLVLAKSMGARPDAVNSSMRLLREERQRDQERLEVALKAHDERERIEKMRRSLEKERGVAESIRNEEQAIRRYSRGQGPRPLEFRSYQFKKSSEASLW